MYFEDIEVGDEAPTVTHTLSRTDLVKYAGASGDFNPMHTDEVKAQAAGQPSVFGHGMLSMGIVGRALTDWLGPGALRRYKVRFTAQTWPEDELTTRVSVTDKRPGDGEHLVDLDCALVNGDGEEVVTGEATAAVSARG